jgi:uncharacterized protein YndB with AHSA1/START domain
MDQYGKLIDKQTLVFERLLPGPIEKIFAYLWDGEKRGQWFASGAMPTVPGERFEMRFKHSDYSPHKSLAPEKMQEVDRNGHNSINTLIAYEPPHRLAFSFGPQTRPGESSEVEFCLKAEGDKVRLTLTHNRIPDRAFLLSVSGGWHSHLDILEYKLRGETPPAFWDVWRRYEGVYDKRHA